MAFMDQQKVEDVQSFQQLSLLHGTSQPDSPTCIVLFIISMIYFDISDSPLTLILKHSILISKIMQSMSHEICINNHINDNYCHTIYTVRGKQNLPVNMIHVVTQMFQQIKINYLPENFKKYTEIKMQSRSLHFVTA